MRSNPELLFAINHEQIESSTFKWDTVTQLIVAALIGKATLFENYTSKTAGLKITS